MNKRKIIDEPKETARDFSVKKYFGADVLAKSAELLEYINRPIFKRKETGINHRNLNWWASEGVLNLSAKEYSKFSFVELVWVKIVEQLRAFSVPLPLIASYKKNIFESIKISGLPNKEEQLKSKLDSLDISAEEKKKILQALKAEVKEKGIDTGVSILQLLIVECILKRKPLAMAFFANGTYMVIDKEKENMYSEKSIEKLNNENYIKINVSKILSEFLKSNLAFKSIPELRLLTHPENKLYEAIKTGEYDSITVHFKDRKIKSLEFKKSAGVQKKIIDILSEASFSEIVVKNKKGVLTKVEENKINF